MDSEINFDNVALEEYEIQHYGFSSTEFGMQLIDEINQTIENIHTEMKESIVSHIKLDDAKREILNKEITDLTQLYLNVCKHLFQNTKKDIKNAFAIPKNVLLEKDQIHAIESAVSTEELENQIKTLEKEYIKEKSLIGAYQEEFEHFEQIERVRIQTRHYFTQIRKIPQALDNINLNKIRKKYQRIIELMKEYQAHNNDRSTTGERPRF